MGHYYICESIKHLHIGFYRLEELDEIENKTTELHFVSWLADRKHSI